LIAREGVVLGLQEGVKIAKDEVVGEQGGFSSPNQQNGKDGLHSSIIRFILFFH
jgi:hypothetical protein